MTRLSLLIVMLMCLAVSTMAQNNVPKPKNPKIDYWEEAWGTSQQLMFTIETDWSGNPVADDCTIEALFTGGDYTILDADKVTYSIYTDNDQLFVFTPEEFPYDFTEPTTELPYGFEGMCCDGTTLYFDNRNAITATEDPFFTWRIGIQVHYTVDGVRNSSDIIYLEVFPQMHPATEVTSTSFVADWTSEPNCMQHAGFVGYDLYVTNMATQETTVIADIPALTHVNEMGNNEPLPGRTYLLEGLTPGVTYEYYVVSKHHWGTPTVDIPSNVQQVTLPLTDGHGYEVGDVNHDNEVSITDATALIDYLLGSIDTICTQCADVNMDDDVTVADVTLLIDRLLGSAAK